MALALRTKTKTRLDTVDLESGDVVAIIDTAMDLDEIAEYMDNSQLAVNSSDEIVLDIDQSALPDTVDRVLGKLSTEFSKGHVASLLRCGMLSLTDYDDLPPSSKKKRPSSKRKAEPTTQPPAPTTDPSDEDLDDESDEDEPSGSNVVDEATRPSAPELSTKNQEPGTSDLTIDPSLDGLPVRIQKVLTVRGLATKTAIQAYIAEGKKLDDVEDIGPKAASQIQSWLA